MKLNSSQYLDLGIFVLVKKLDTWQFFSPVHCVGCQDPEKSISCSRCDCWCRCFCRLGCCCCCCCCRLGCRWPLGEVLDRINVLKEWVKVLTLHNHNQGHQQNFCAQHDDLCRNDGWVASLSLILTLSLTHFAHLRLCLRERVNLSVSYINSLSHSLCALASVS